jgi:peptidoglycan/LPS O-acetylase OafA/YrhL
VSGPADRARPSLIEILVVAGAAAALAAIPIAVGPDATDETIAIVGLLATVALLAGGALLAEGAARARSVVWLLAVLAWTGVAVVVLTEVISDGPEGKWLVASVAGLAFVLAAVLWWVERRSLQLIAVLASGTLALAAIAYTEQAVSVLGFDVGQGIPDPTWSAVMIMVIGAAALVTGIRELLAPRRTAMVLGSLWLIGGAYFVDIDTDVLGGDVGPSTLALAIALAASVAVIVVGNLWEDRAVAGIGIAGLLFVSTALVGDLVEDTGPAVVVIVIGVAMVVVGAVLSRRGGGAAAVPPGPVEVPLASDPLVPPAPPDAPGDPQD